MDLELDLNHKKSIGRVSIFIFTFLIVFLLTLFQKIYPNFKPMRLLSPQPNNAAVLNSIAPKLDKIPNNFKVKKQTSLVEKTFASSFSDNASSYAVIDYETGDAITSKNISKELPIASLTKIMTAVVVSDLTKPDELITISKNAARQEPTKIGVVPGQKMTVEELLNATLMTSANDAAQALRDGIDQKYGASIFEDAMNKKAQIIGLKNTIFTNPQGYDYENNHSTAEDLAVVARYALKNYPLIGKIVAKDYQFYPATSLHKQFDLYNWNGLLGIYPGVSGVKIGNTASAGYTSVVVSEREGKKLISVLLGAPGIIERDLWTSKLLDFAFNKAYGLSYVSLTESNLRQKYSTWKFWN